MDVLSVLTREVPGLQEAQFLMAKAKFLQSDFNKAQILAASCVEKEPDFIRVR